MKIKSLLASTLVGLMVAGGAALNANAYDTQDYYDGLDTNLDVQYAGRDITVSATSKDSLDLVKVVPYVSPSYLRFQITNKSANAIFVNFPALNLGLLVPGNSERNYSVNALEIGHQGVIEYSATEFIPTPAIEISNESIRYILDPSYVTFPKDYGTKPEPKYWNSPGRVRGYW